MKDLREKTVSGVAWTGIGQAGRQVIILIANVIMSRLLTPRDFGLMATAVIFSNFAFIISEQGLLVALVQRKEVSEEHLSSTFWFNAAVGVALAAVFTALAPVLARVYGEPNLAPVMRIISAMFVIYPVGMVHKALLTRRLEFRAVALSEMASAWFGGVAGVLFAWFGHGVFSVAYQFVIEFVAGAAVLWVLCEWRPRALLRWRALKELNDFSVPLFINNVLSYWVRNVDNLLIGLVLGTYPLGLYSRAYAVMLFPLSRLSWMFSRVMTRSFALIQDDAPRVRGIFLKMTRVVALATFPMMLGVAASAPAFVACVFGPQWGAMVPTLRVLALVGMIQSVTALLSNLYLSRGRTDLNLRVSLPIQALQVAGIVIGLKWGIYGVACGYALASLATAPLDCYFGGGLIGLSVGEFFSNLAGLFACAAAMAAAVAGLGRVLPESVPMPIRFALQVALGAAVYGGLLHSFTLSGYRDLMALARERWTAFRGAAA